MGQIKRGQVRRGLRLLGIILGWGVSNAAVALAGIFQGILVPPPSGSNGPSGGGGSAQVPFGAVLATASNVIPTSWAFQDLFQASVLGVPFGKVFFFLAIIGIAILASFLIESGTEALVSFLFSYTLSMVIVYFVLILPGLVGSFQGNSDSLLTLGILFTFLVFFPIPLVLGLLGTLVGVSLAERFS